MSISINVVTPLESYAIQDRIYKNFRIYWLSSNQFDGIHIMKWIVWHVECFLISAKCSRWWERHHWNGNIVILTGCTEIYHFDNCSCNQLLKFHYNGISVSVMKRNALAWLCTRYFMSPITLKPRKICRHANKFLIIFGVSVLIFALYQYLLTKWWLVDQRHS